MKPIVSSDELKSCLVKQLFETLMRKQDHPPVLEPKNWNAPAEDVAEELHSFIQEFGSFTPDRFAQIKFHLLRYSGLDQESRDNICQISIYNALCPKCAFLYTAKKCLLWYDLFKMIRWKTVERSPPCIRLAFAKKSIKNVTKFLVKTNLIDAPFYNARSAPSCRAMRNWGYCNPDRYCRAMKTGNTSEYNSVRERVKLSGVHDDL